MINGNGLNKIMFNGQRITNGILNGQYIKLVQLLEYLAKDVKITRAGLSSNPLQNYSFVSGDISQTNTLVTHGDYAFVGGDTQEFEFDFGLKVANSVAECPMKMFWTIKNTSGAVLSVNDITSDNTTGWKDDTSQSDLDKIKTLDNLSVTSTRTISGQLAQLMLELDLTPLCNSLFGGSNSALKSALKSITADVWAQGSGSNGGVLGNGCKMSWWEQGSNLWVDRRTNGGNSVVLMSFNSPSNSFISTNNKLYILIASQYPSDGTIPSQVQLDYVNIKIALARVPDVVQPIPVNLPKYWAMVGNFSPIWTNSTTSKRLFSFYTDNNNRVVFSILSTNGLQLYKAVGVGVSIHSSIQSFFKNQMYKFIVGQSASGMFMYLLKNNGAVEKYINTDTTILSGLMPLHLLNQNNAEQADAFAESFHLVDLERIGKSNGFTDAEADAILRGVLPNSLGIEQRELFDINKVVLMNGSTIDNQTIVSKLGTGYNYTAEEFISVLPNNRYNVKVNTTGSTARLLVQPYYNNIAIGISSWIILNGTGEIDFTTPPNCNKIAIIFNGDISNQMTWSNISLKLKM